MKLFIDTANVDDIRRANDMGIICGVTTNPSLIAKEGRDFKQVVKEITEIVDGPVSAEVISLEADRKGYKDKRYSRILSRSGTSCRKSRRYICKPVPRQT